MQAIKNAITVNCGMLAAFLVAACAADEPTEQRPTLEELRSTNACVFRDGGSRWAPSQGRYVMTAEFGRAEEEYFFNPQGVVASPTGDVFIWDVENTRVVQLDRDLQLVGTFGREGRGPGEFTYQRFISGDWIAAEDSAVYVLDMRTLSEFDLDGEFKRYVTSELPFLYPPRPVRRIAAREGQVVYMVDATDIEHGARALETWRLESSRPHTLLRTDSMPTRPMSNGRAVMGSLFILQADPIWALHGRCAFMSDGAGDWVLRVDLDTNRADTLYLPSREPAELTAEDEEWLGAGRRALTRASASGRSEEVEPTARLLWADIIVDPDGYVWLEPWRPRSMEGEPFTAWVVDPATGAVDSVTVEAFPDAFLPGGAFVSRVFDRREQLTLVHRYTIEPARE